MRKIMKICTLVAAAATLFTTTSTVYAQENLPDSLKQEGLNCSSVFEDFNSYLDNMQIEQGSLFETNASVDNFQLLNYKYQSLTNQMEMQGFGDKSELNKPQFQTGYAMDIETLFNDSYGDIAENAKLENPEIPESFDVSAMMKKAQELRASALGDFKNSESYKTTVGNISIGNVFKAAAEVKAMPELMSAKEMQKRLSSLSGMTESMFENNKPSVNLDALLSNYKKAADSNKAGSSAADNKAKTEAAFEAYRDEVESWISWTGVGASRDF